MGLAACFLVTGCALLIGNLFFWKRMIVFKKVKRSVERLGERNARVGHIALSVMCIVVGIIDLAWPGTILKGKPRQRFADQTTATDSPSSAPTTPPVQSGSTSNAPASPPASAQQPQRPQDLRNRIVGTSETKPTNTAPTLPNSLKSTSIPGPGQSTGNTLNTSAPQINRTALPPATNSVPAASPTTASSSSPPPATPTKTAPAATTAAPSTAKVAAVAEAPESWPLPKSVLQDDEKLPDDRALKAISLSLRNPEAGEPVADDTPLQVGSVVLAVKKSAGLRLAAVREVKEGGVLSVAFLGDNKAAPMDVTRADLKLPAESIRNLVIASGWSIPAAMPLSKEMLLETERPGNRFRTVAVIESLADGKVKIHYVGWGADTVARSTLRFPTGVTVD